jgi:ribosomal protein S18 acetylase RimI-like enzyme
MPRLTDSTEIRRRLETDRPWAAYALGDLAPGFAEKSEWHGAPDGDALLLLYRAPETPVLFTLGPPDEVRPLLEEVRVEPALYLSIKPEIMPLIEAHWGVRDEARMWRMILAREDFQPGAAEGAVRLARADLPALTALFDDGLASGERPDFFHADMLDTGLFYGVFEGRALIAAAGTHLIAPRLGVAAVGNVYTRRDRRGRGLARCVTGAVVAELVEMKLATIALNVNQRNRAAIQVYEHLGFARYCGFCEGIAVSKAGYNFDDGGRP